MECRRPGHGNVFLDIAGAGRQLDALKGFAGARAWHSFPLINGMEITPEVRARVLYDFLNDQRAFTSTFVTDPTQTAFPVSGITPGRTAALLGGGLNVRVAPLWRAFVNYDAELRGGYTAQTVNGGVKLSW